MPPRLPLASAQLQLAVSVQLDTGGEVATLQLGVPAHSTAAYVLEVVAKQEAVEALVQQRVVKKVLEGTVSIAGAQVGAKELIGPLCKDGVASAVVVVPAAKLTLSIEGSAHDGLSPVASPLVLQQAELAAVDSPFQAANLNDPFAYPDDSEDEMGANLFGDSDDDLDLF